ncbi:DUF5937 family protein [Kitasatospora sp. NPDC092948]|uniref:DUF5937 family protein n=1 Tax=Kitasatospora sp. NPDC092948 TaxID=3364088 RepID=UPI0038247601
MSVTIDITGLPPERIVFRPSPLAELGNALHALAEPAHHTGLHAWTTATTAALAPDLADRLLEAEFMWGATRSDFLLPASPRETLAEELDDLDRMDDEKFVGAALEISCSSSHYPKGLPSPLVDPRSRRRALDLAAARGPRQAAFVERMLGDPAGARAWIRRLLEDCDRAFFADTWQRVREGLAADARDKTELLRRKGLAAALTAASPALGLAEDEHGSRIVVDKLVHGRTWADTAVTLLPSVFGRPHLFTLYAPGWQPVIQYPAAAHELGHTGSAETIVRRLEALTHPVRISMCRHLARGAYSTNELADASGITAPEASRHLAVLRKAGLVATRRRGRYLLHQLDLPVVARIGGDFLESVLR